ncbi:MAG: hypothetical protein HY682_03750 [Chloroflexi bacterium]|nr:hypothetical protein [Chloroflexota bacterium]
MDPEPLSKAQWADVGFAIKLLWVSLALMFTAAQLFLAAHAIIPSAVASHHLPARFTRLRPALYAGGFVCLAGVGASVYWIVSVIGAGDLAHSIYPRYFK